MICLGAKSFVAVDLEVWDAVELLLLRPEVPPARFDSCVWRNAAVHVAFTHRDYVACLTEQLRNSRTTRRRRAGI